MKNVLMEILLIFLVLFFLFSYWDKVEEIEVLQQEIATLKKENDRMTVQLDLRKNQAVIQPRPLKIGE